MKLAEFPITNNRFHGKVVIIRTPYDARITATCEFVLNGKTIEVSRSVQEDVHIRDPKVLLRALHQGVANVVASEMLIDAMKGVDW